jgi:hypothetical protein
MSAEQSFHHCFTVIDSRSSRCLVCASLASHSPPFALRHYRQKRRRCCSINVFRLLVLTSTHRRITQTCRPLQQRRDEKDAEKKRYALRMQENLQRRNRAFSRRENASEDVGVFVRMLSKQSPGLRPQFNDRSVWCNCGDLDGVFECMISLGVGLEIITYSLCCGSYQVVLRSLGRN